MMQATVRKALRRLEPLPLFSARPQCTFSYDGRDVEWERCVYNAAALRLDGMVYVLYRSLGEDGVSRLGLWWSEDGVTQAGRLDFPVFGPEVGYEMPPAPEARRAEQIREHGMVREVGGTEDPRLIPVGDQLYMFYTAYGDIGRLTVARIPIREFLRGVRECRSYEDWQPLWERMGMVYESEMDKDGYLLPVQVRGKWILFHRFHPDIQVVELDELRFPIQDPGKILLGPRPGMWDEEKIGGGAPPMRTELGWVHIYHGVGSRNGRRTYVLGSFVTPLDDPFRVIRRSTLPIMVPEEKCELEGWVPDVVFTCGVVPVGKDSRELLSAEDDILVYYGGADEVMCVAIGKVGEIAGI